MATSQKLTEHYLTCVICSDVFTNPCTLVCNHTFCRKCVVNYTKTRPEAISAKSLLCPFCNKMTKVSAPERPVEEWADDVKPCFVIQGLLDSFGPGSKDTTNCSYCKVEGETTPASVWCYVCDDALCGRCVKVHSLIPATRHHDVTDLSGEVKVKRRRTVMCKEHTDESIKLLCKDCKKAVCQTCCTIYHRKCESVVSLGVEIRAMKAVLTRATGNLSRRKDEISKEIETKKSKLEDETCRFKQMESDINSAKVKAIERIKLREKDLLDQLKEMSDKHLGQLKADIKSGDMSVQMYQQQAELIDQALQSECDMDVYEMYQGCEAGDVEAVGDSDLKERERIAMVRQYTDKLSKSLDDLQLGEIDVLYEGVLDLKTTPVSQGTTNALDLKMTPVLQDTINLREMKAALPQPKDIVGLRGQRVTPVLQGTLNVTSERGKCKAEPWDVVAIVVNGIDTVVVTDKSNHSVDSFYTWNNQQGHSELLLGGSPYGITKLTHNQVAVTVQDAHQIVTVQVNPDLVLLSTIKTNKRYWGITSLTPSTLAASSQSPCIDILDMAGNVLRSICPLQEGHDILKRPDFLCTTRTGNILVSDNGSKCVMCLTHEGDVVFKYSPTGYTGLACPYGITSTSKGDILVADHNRQRVIYLTERGKFVKELLTSQDHMCYPYGMCTDEKGRMYVCQRNGVIQTFLCGN
ncbi:tripartite motif-containing protein 2-like [Haliotis rufescens]|uniref:tripartite motif-containing protein 2-like n=1 Tax=Haliotis rufescens TaxID=6454 RepID=UPI00201E75D9|nr:tripartite motif-containing protein 2-like [Haliotis rufescens]